MPRPDVPNSRLAKAVSKLAVHDHTALIFQGAREKLAVMVPYLEAGFERGERCVYLVPFGTGEAALRELAAAGVDVDSAVARGALVVTTAEVFLPHDHHFDPSLMVAFWERTSAEAKEAGFSGVRLSDDKTWILHYNSATDLLAGYESLLNDFVGSRQLSVLCMYDFHSFSPEVLLSVIETHPTVISGGVLLHNYNYLPPDQFLGPHRLRHLVAHLLEGMSQSEAMLEDLRMQRTLLRTVFENTSDGIFIKDQEGRYLMINEAGAAFLGSTPEEVVGRNDAEFLSPADAADVAESVCRASDSSLPTVAEHSFTVGGVRRTFLTTKGRYCDETGRVIGIYGIARDITERKRHDEEIAAFQGRLRLMSCERSRIEEQERRRIASALHDQIGQSLALAKIRLQFQQESADESVAKEIGHVCDLLDFAIRQTRSLTVELSPPILYELGLEAAVAALCEDFEEQHGLEVVYRDDGRRKQLPEDLRVLLFQAVRELLVNVVKHAQASRVEVTVHRGADRVSITVADNGVGIDGDVTVRTGDAAFGLFNLRERLKFYDGGLQVASAPGAGTAVTVCASVRQEPSL